MQEVALGEAAGAAPAAADRPSCPARRPASVTASRRPKPGMLRLVNDFGYVEDPRHAAAPQNHTVILFLTFSTYSVFRLYL